MMVFHICLPPTTTILILLSFVEVVHTTTTTTEQPKCHFKPTLPCYVNFGMVYFYFHNVTHPKPTTDILFRITNIDTNTTRELQGEEGRVNTTCLSSAESLNFPPR